MITSEQAVKQSAKSAFKSNEEQFLFRNEEISECGLDPVEYYAEGLHGARSERDIKRDKEHNASLTDYKRWVEEAYIDWFPVGSDDAELEVITEEHYTEEKLRDIIEADPAGDRGYDWEFSHIERYEGKRRAIFKAI